jgi:hydroxymethylpyrimidine pyrophosphatase-like HAD family hydrolase
MARPILCFDLDGTLLDQRGRIHPADRAILADPDPPAWLIPATGRPLVSIRHTFTQNGLFAGRPIPLPMVLQNGSLLCLPGEVEAAYFPFLPEVSARLIALAAAYPQVMFLYIGRETIKVLNPTPFGISSADRYEIPIHPMQAPEPGFTFSKLMCVSQSPGLLAEVRDWTAELPVEGAYSLATIFELNPQGVSKGQGVRLLLEKMGLAGQPFFAAGDGGNDRVLLGEAQLAFAPVSAPPEIRALAAHTLDVRAQGLLGPMLARS